MENVFADFFLNAIFIKQVNTIKHWYRITTTTITTANNNNDNKTKSNNFICVALSKTHVTKRFIEEIRNNYTTVGTNQGKDAHLSYTEC